MVREGETKEERAARKLRKAERKAKEKNTDFNIFSVSQRPYVGDLLQDLLRKRGEKRELHKFIELQKSFVGLSGRRRRKLQMSACFR